MTEDEAIEERPDDAVVAELDPDFEALLEHLKESRGFDFTGYKRPSLMRRVRRQMHVVSVPTFEEYKDFLEVHPDEFTALFNTILINVTSFFRDPEAWAYLRAEVLPDLLARRAGETIRIWSAGCATGEEAYSLAIALAELLGVEEFRSRVKVYATDVDEEALAHARQATYSERELRGLSPEQIETYFDPVGQRRTFRKDLRRAVIFGRNDLVQDAPISHVDLLTCRNTLMYFNAETQGRILGRLHFGLNPGGVLFLGKAEMLLSHGALFAPLELKRRFFRKIAAPASADRRLVIAESARGGKDLGPNTLLRERALMSSPTAQIVLDDVGRLVSANARAELLFGLDGRDSGRPFQDLELSYRPLELRSFIEQAARERRTIWARDVEYHPHGGERSVLDIQVIPLTHEAGSDLGITVVFHDVTRHRQLQAELQYANRQLETAYEELQSTNEELETTNEELQSTVEELETTNEELQSTNEELETMNEELQSMNDELQASNEELRRRTTEVGSLNAFMENVLASLRAGVAVVDADLRVLAWNRRAEDLWGVRQDEAVTRHLLNLDIGLPMDRLRPLLRAELGGAGGAEGQDVVLDAVNRRGKPITVRVSTSPLRRDGEEVGGVILVMEPLPS